MGTQYKNILKAFDGSYKRGQLEISGRKKGSKAANAAAKAGVVDSVAFSGLIDLGTLLNEPGFEFRETLEQTAAAALAGGYHVLLAMSPDESGFDSKAFLETVARRSPRSLPLILPIANLTQLKEGKEFVEFNDLHKNGAIAFSDGLKPVKDAGILLRALEYVKSFDGLIITSPLDRTLYPFGQMHEGAVSTILGLSGMPAISEEIIVHRDINLAKLSGGRLHLYCISSAGSIELIKKAKKEGVRVTCSVSVNNLLFSDEDLISYDPNLKLLPPLRDVKTQKALWKALQDGVIDLIVSQHQPLEPEQKDLEFSYAAFGALGLQTAVPALLEKFGLDDAAPVIQKAMCDNVKDLFRLDIDTGIVTFGKIAQQVSRENLISNCYNSPFLNRELQFQLI